MRVAMFAAAAAFVSLTACGGPETSQANNAQANISNGAHPEATNAMVMLSMPKEKLVQVMHARHEGMESIGKATKAASRELKGGSPDLGVVRSSAGQIAKLSRQASGWFPKGSGPELGKTGAKLEIWQDPKDFAAKLHNFQVAAKAFNAATAGNDVTAIKARFGDMGGACKACHDKYRSEMHH